jgi:hypothetical protein
MNFTSYIYKLILEAKSERTKTGYKVPGKYLTKDKADMKDEIERVRNLSPDDSSAYGKWKADYADKGKKKKYQTKKSKATIAYEKMYGSKDESVKNTVSEVSKGSSVDKALENKAKKTGISKSILKAVYAKGARAWKGGHRPGVSQHQWAAGRVNSFLTGKGGARKADAKLWKKAKK